MVPSRSLRTKRLNTLIRTISYRRIPRGTIVVGVPRERLSIAY